MLSILQGQYRLPVLELATSARFRAVEVQANTDNSASNLKTQRIMRCTMVGCRQGAGHRSWQGRDPVLRPQGGQRLVPCRGRRPARPGSTLLTTAHSAGAGHPRVARPSGRRPWAGTGPPCRHGRGGQRQGSTRRSAACSAGEAAHPGAGECCLQRDLPAAPALATLPQRRPARSAACSARTGPRSTLLTTTLLHGSKATRPCSGSARR